jgi:geranylgeranyl pyrophosphate synthase
VSTHLAALHEAPGLDGYLERVEEALDETVARHPGIVAVAGRGALAAGGKRLRPALVFLTSGGDAQAALPGGVAIELVHTATLVHDDVIDGAPLRRGHRTAWSEHGPGVAKAAGDYLFARAFAALAGAGDAEGIRILADAALALVRGEALQRRQRHDPDTPIEAYLERSALKSGSLFEAACLLGGRRAELGAFGRALGIAFQITDDMLDCTGETIETGKIAGTDLRDGTPTLPLILAARQDEIVRQALAGGPLNGALLRVGATDALEKSRSVALDYAREARDHLGQGLRTDALEALTHIVIDRDR